MQLSPNSQQEYQALIRLVLALKEIRPMEKTDFDKRRTMYDSWNRAVNSWLGTNFPHSSASAHWLALRTPRAIAYPHYATHEELIESEFESNMKDRLRWLANRFDGNSAIAAKEKREFGPSRKVFLVHGHDHETRDSVEHFLLKQQLEVVILDEAPNKGMTIPEKIEEHAEVAFAVVLLTPDDRGGTRGTPYDHQLLRARQNVILELGYFVARLGRERVCCLRTPSVEIPSDYHGVVYVPLDASGGWQARLLRELSAFGLGPK